MTIIHTVVFSLAHPPGSSGEAEFLRAARETLTEIPGVNEFAIRRQVSPHSSFRFQFSMSFADQASYDAYNVHPAHLGFVANRWKPEVIDFQEYDFLDA